MADPAYETIEPAPPVETVERVRLATTVGGTPSAAELIRALRRRGYRDDEVEEIALVLSEEDYRRVREVNRALPPRPLPKVRR